MRQDTLKSNTGYSEDVGNVSFQMVYMNSQDLVLIQQQKTKKWSLIAINNLREAIKPYKITSNKRFRVFYFKINFDH